MSQRVQPGARKVGEASERCATSHSKTDRDPVRSIGQVTAELKLRYPTESELQIEQWADKGEPTAIVTHGCQ